MTSSLRFNERSHRYWLDGRPIPGVTTLIKGGIPAPQLIYWASRTVAEYVADNPDAVDALRPMGRNSVVAALKEVPWTRRDTAAVRGTEVHALAEQLVAGTEVEVPDHLIGYVEGYARWLDKNDLRPVLVERPVAHRGHWYAGRFDLIGDLDCRHMLDIKTASGIYPEVALQLDAYRNAQFYVDDAGEEQPLPEGIERISALHVQDGYTELVPLDSSGEPYRDFLHAAWLARRADKRKTYVQPATDGPADRTAP